MRSGAVDVKELSRFILTGVTATLGNLAAVWLARSYLPFETALFGGIAAGLTISFVLSKWFAFGSRSWSRAPGEMVRFLLVYAVSCTLYWVIAVMTGRALASTGIGGSWSEGFGILGGAGVMTLTSYVGHRYFTYRTHRRPVLGMP